MSPEITQLRYIVFLIDSKLKQHDGKVFKSHKDAKDFTRDMFEEKYADKAVIGMFVEDGSEWCLISLVETIGFKGDKKNVEQLELFKKQ